MNSVTTTDLPGFETQSPDFRSGAPVPFRAPLSHSLLLILISEDASKAERQLNAWRSDAKGQAWYGNGHKLPIGTQGPKVRNLVLAGPRQALWCARGQVQNCKASSVCWRQKGTKQAGLPEQHVVKNECVWFNFRHPADL